MNHDPYQDHQSDHVQMLLRILVEPYYSSKNFPMIIDDYQMLFQLNLISKSPTLIVINNHYYHDWIGLLGKFYRKPELFSH